MTDLDRMDPRPATNEPPAIVAFLTMKWDLCRRQLSDLQRRHEHVESELRLMREECPKLGERLDEVESARAVGAWFAEWTERRSRWVPARRVRNTDSVSTEQLRDAVRVLTLVNPEEYRVAAGDLGGLSPEEHFVRVGFDRGLPPNARFHPERYLERNPDVAREGMNPVGHYLLFGWREGRCGVGGIRLRREVEVG